MAGAMVLLRDKVHEGGRRVAAAIGAADDRGMSFLRVSPGAPDAGVYPAVAAVSGATLIAFTAEPPDQSVIQVRILAPDR